MSPRLLVGSLAVLALATPPSHAQEDERVELAAAQNEERRVLRELTDLERELLGIEPEIEELSTRADQLEQQRVVHADELTAAQTSLDRITEQVSQRLRALYRIDKRGFARIIFSAEDPADLRRTARYLRAVLQADHSRSQRFLEQVKLKEAALTRVESDRAALAALQAELRLKEASLRDTQARRLALLEEIRERRDLAQSALRERNQARRDLSRRISSATRSPTSTGSSSQIVTSPTEASQAFRSLAGELPWPTSGTLMQSFGPRVNSRNGTDRNDGIDIKAAYGTPFRAVAEGVVQHTGFVPAFGLIVLLQHGPYSTVYAHAGRIQVARGQRVRAGDVLGLVGETGVTDGEGPRLHFEIRYHETPQDPMNWLRSRGRR